MAIHLLSLKEGNVEDGGVKIHKLEHEHFECQTIFVFCLRSMHFWRGKRQADRFRYHWHEWPLMAIELNNNYNNHKMELY